MIPARLFGRKASGGKIEVLVERMLDDKRILAHIRASKAPKPGAELLLGDDESINATMTARHGALFEVEFNDQRSVLDILNSIGHMPLPPYIDRPDEDARTRRTLYKRFIAKTRRGSSTAAGLHFDEPLLEKLRAKGVEMAFVTLHVGAGTFQPVRVDTIEDHIMHSEYAEVPQDVVDAVLAAKARGNRVIAVGTTSVRSLESAAQAAKNDLIEPFFDDTQIFIYPGFQYKVVDALVTNFHLPESTLIMLVSAFAGYQHTMNAYKAAVEEKYSLF